MGWFARALCFLFFFHKLWVLFGGFTVLHWGVWGFDHAEGAWFCSGQTRSSLPLASLKGPGDLVSISRVASKVALVTITSNTHSGTLLTLLTKSPDHLSTLRRNRRLSRAAGDTKAAKSHTWGLINMMGLLGVYTIVKGP